MVKKIISAKMLLLSIALFSFSICVFAQSVEEVTLTVSGDGATKKEAIDIALRSAVEQAFGVFVSANTTVLNDTLVKDEIATVSSGNIKKYEEIASMILPNGNSSVTLKAIVSISKLAKFAESHGSSVEFAGSTFGANMKLKELNKANEEKAIENLIFYLNTLCPTMFDYKLELGDPKVSSYKSNGKECFEIEATVTTQPNKVTLQLNSYMLNVLHSLSLTPTDITEYTKNNLEVFKISIGLFRSQRGLVYKNHNGDVDSYFFRSNKSRKLLEQFITCNFRNAIYNFKIIDNLNSTSSIETINGGYFYNTSYDYNFVEYKIDDKNGVVKSRYEYQPYGPYKNVKYYGLIIDSDERQFRKIAPSSNNYCSDCDLYQFVLQHIYGQNYKLNLTLAIPKEDISKYSKFTIESKNSIQ